MAQQREHGITWTEQTWNPLRGCSRVSEGCRHCYAERVAYRFSGPGQPYEGLVRIDSKGERQPQWNGTVRIVEEHLLDPLKWKRPRRVFVNSMSDLFHESVADETIDHIFAVMALCPHHTFQVLTKRPERMLAYMGRACGRIADRVMKMRSARNDRRCVGPLPHLPPGAAWWPLANVWPGVSVEDQPTADARIPLLLQTPAAVRWISAEPLLGLIDLFNVPRPDVPYFAVRGERGCIGPKTEPDDFVYEMKRLLHWVVVGGESGPGARPMHPDWARSLRDQCVAASVPFHFKQWGEYASVSEVAGPGAHYHFEDGATVRRVGKHAAGRTLGGRTWDEYPQ